MKTVIAIDSLKGSLTSREAGEAARRGVLAADATADVSLFPLADGGEGTVHALIGAEDTLVPCTVRGPLGDPVSAEYGIRRDGTAVIEMAAAAGLPLVPPALRDVKRASTYGVGELIADAIRRGCRRFLIGIGGSATNDGGTGMLRALGVRFTDEASRELPEGGMALAGLAAIDTSGLLPALADCDFSVACDVDNPLCGERGASAVFAPQKGARPEEIPLLDAALARFAEVTAHTLGHDRASTPGAGAAGGLGFALLAFLGARLAPGVEVVMEATGLLAALADAELVITGEGRLDGQSAFGKAPVGLALAAKAHGATVIALGGSLTDEAALLHGYGIDAILPILDAPCTLAEAMERERTARNIERTACEAVRLYRSARGRRP